MQSVAGRLFITRGDLRRLACDAWALPTDAAGRFNEIWFDGLEALEALAHSASPLEGERARAIGTDPESDATVWLIDTGGFSDQPISWYLDAVEEFIRGAAGEAARTSRTKRLLGIPLVGTGDGGAAKRSGIVVKKLVQLLQSLAEELDVDVALVARNPAALAAAQQARRGLGSGVWSDLDGPMRSRAARLAEHARRGNLVLFLGAGASRGAGLPLWSQLLEELASECIIADEHAAFHRLDALDQARLLELRRGSAVKQQVIDRFRGNTRSLVHELLASMKVNENATTNYDQRYEAALRDQHGEVAVLPWDPAAGTPWLLKLHGDIDHADSIVLTRDDYMRYDSTRAALAGIVQALLITRHMLFVGFSLDDPNFHRIVHDVRQAVGTSNQRRDHFGTALVFGAADLRTELWDEDLELIAMPEPSARRTEIFLDLLLDQSTPVGSYLLDEDYDDLLTDGERDLRASLSALRAGLSEELREAPAWAELDLTLRRLGLKSGAEGVANPLPPR